MINNNSPFFGNYAPLVYYIILKKSSKEIIILESYFFIISIYNDKICNI